MTALSLENAALQFHGWGANINAIREGSKGPINTWKPLCSRRQSAGEVKRLPWGEAAGVGVINGPGGWRTVDIDAKKRDEHGTLLPPAQIVPVPESVLYAVLQALGLPADYPWTWRSGSGTGWEIAVICHDELPEGVLSAKEKEPGVFWSTAKDGDVFDHLELRWEHCQTIYPPSAYEKLGAPGYHWRGEAPDAPPTIVGVGQVLNAFFAVAVRKKAEPKPEPKPKREVARMQSSSVADAIAEVKRRFDLVAYARAHWPGELQQERNGEIRICGHGGLLINEEKQEWHCFGWEAGGDAIELVGRKLYGDGWKNDDGAKFWEALEEAARETNVTLPPKPQGNAGKVTISGRRVWNIAPMQADDELVTLRRSDYEHLRARAEVADQLEGWRTWAETILSRDGLKPTEKGVFIGLYPIIDATRRLGGNDGRVPLNYDHAADVLKTSKSTVGRAVEIGEQVGLWRRDPEMAQTKDGYEIQHMRLELQPAFDEPQQLLPVDRPKHGGARPGAGRKPKCPHCPAGTIHRMVTKRTAVYYCAQHGEIGAEALPDLIENYVAEGENQDETIEQQVLTSVPSSPSAEGENQDETRQTAESSEDTTGVASDSPVVPSTTDKTYSDQPEVAIIGRTRIGDAIVNLGYIENRLKAGDLSAIETHCQLAGADYGAVIAALEPPRVLGGTS
jgi:hypothetical protein